MYVTRGTILYNCHNLYMYDWFKTSYYMGTVYIYIFGPDIIICKEVYVSLEVPVHQD